MSFCILDLTNHFQSVIMSGNMCDPFTSALIATVVTGTATASAMKKAAPKAPALPTKISQPPTAISAGEQGKKSAGDEPVDLLSTIIAGSGRKNKLG